MAWTAAIGSTLSGLGAAFKPGPLEAHRSIDNPVGIGGILGGIVEVLGSAGTAVLILSVLASGISLILRLRRARGVERQQIKWPAYTVVMAASGSVLTYTVSEAIGAQWLELAGFVIFIAALSLSLRP